jgi:putative oxidoreductase
MMKTATAEKWRHGLRWFLGLILLWAAVSKLANPEVFLGSILAYELPLPRTFLQLVAVVLPWLELLCGLMLLAKMWTPSALAWATGLMAVFVLATGQAWLRGLTISCGCFDLSLLGITRESSPKLVGFLESVGFAFFRNLVLTGIAVHLLRWHLDELKASFVPTKPWMKKGKGHGPATA